MASEIERARRVGMTVIARVVIDLDPDSYRFGDACRVAPTLASRVRALAARFLERYTALAPADRSVDRRLGARLDIRV
jgi:hypothetical protein